MASAHSLVDQALDGRYRITRQLGEGGMGMVYEGVQVALDRKVAIKVLHTRLADDERFRERFIREARSASRIRHPNVVQILDFGETSDGLAYFVMEFLEGRDLRSLLNEVGRLPWSRARWILLQAVRALRAAHGKSIIHRDIKPGNCFLYDSPDEGTVDNVKLLDFGIAKIGAEGHEGDPHDRSLTNTGEVFGTASYMAPEQARGEVLDVRSDVYSLGIMAYEMLVGAVPFTGANPIHVITRHLTDPPRPLRELEPSIPRAVEALVLRAIEKQQEHRFASMAELEEALAAIPGDASASPLVADPEPRDRPIVVLPPSQAHEGAQPGTMVLTGQTTSPRPQAAPITQVLHLESQPPPSTPLAAPVVSSAVGTHDESSAASRPEGAPERTEAVSSQALFVSMDASNSSSHPQWASHAAGERSVSQDTRPPPGEVDMATAPQPAAAPSVAATGPLPREASPLQVADTNPHSISTVQRRERSPRATWIFGVLTLLGGGAVVAAVTWSDGDGEPGAIVASVASEPRPAAPASANAEPSRAVEHTPSPAALSAPAGAGPAEGGGPVAGAEDGGQIIEPVTASSPGTPETGREADAEAASAVAPEPVEASQAKPAKKASPAPAAPRKKTDAQVKSKLEQAILRACASVGAGTRVKVELTVGSDGAILLKNIQVEGSVKECVAKQLSKAAFPEGGIRKLEIDVQL